MSVSRDTPVSVELIWEQWEHIAEVLDRPDGSAEYAAMIRDAIPELTPTGLGAVVFATGDGWKGHWVRLGQESTHHYQWRSVSADPNAIIWAHTEGLEIHAVLSHGYHWDDEVPF